MQISSSVEHSRVALHPLRQSAKGLLWRPHPRAYCRDCGHGRAWHDPDDETGSLAAPPEGALGQRCACGSGSAPEVGTLGGLEPLADDLILRIIKLLCRCLRCDSPAGECH
eukprot:SAG22_NODE_13625_length_400_cov_0.747508_1_plen_110_part_10